MRKLLMVSVGTMMAMVLGAGIGVLGSCARAPQPGVPSTPLQRVIVYNAVLAKANNTAEQAVERLQAQSVINLDQTRAALVVIAQVASVSQSLKKITEAPGDWLSMAAQVRSVLNSSGISDKLAKLGVTDQTLYLALQDIAAALTLIEMEVQP